MRKTTKYRPARLPNLPLEDLERHLPEDDQLHHNHGTKRLRTNGHIARLVGVDQNTVLRWRKHGIPYWSADAACIATGLHPVEVWADFYTDIPLDLIDPEGEP